MDCCNPQTHAAHQHPPVTNHPQPASNQPKPGRWHIALAVVPVLAAVGVAAVALTRSNSNGPSATKAGTVVARSSGNDEVSDTGPGAVTASAKFERAQSGNQQLVFTLTLNTHSVDLSSFNPQNQVRLRAGNAEYQPQLRSDPAGQSSHHRNYTLAFTKPDNRTITLVVADVAGVTERQLPFTL